ncbi:MAG TPA: hypothetical protein VK988_10930 [Acidimicrobiales bacterium]|nr:hypothetical protein [Acidimicrobiales bacterium]
MIPPDPRPPTDERTQKFDMVAPMLESAHKEMSDLSKKKQDGVLNELKVRHINRLLVEAREALGDDPSLAFVELLDEDDLPQNSDAVLVLGQWLAAMSQFKGRHYAFDPDVHQGRWFTVEDPHPWNQDEEAE